MESRSSGKQLGPGDVTALNFGLFTSRPSPLTLLRQSSPVIWLTLLMRMWPQLLRSYLLFIQCMVVPEDNGASQHRLVHHPEVVCWSKNHWPLATVAILGLLLWCLGLPLALFLKIWRSPDRLSQENSRKYGFFIEGYEPRFWWWDIVVKRLDIAVMLLIAYTSIAPDDRSKLLLFPLISAIQLGIACCCKPFANDQAQILDFLEVVLMGSRFVLFAAIAVLLVLNPSSRTTLLVSVMLLLLLLVVSMFLLLHAASQKMREYLAGEHHEDEEELYLEQHRHKTSFKELGVQGKERAIRIFLPLLQEDEHTRCVVSWSCFDDKVLFQSQASHCSSGYRPQQSTIVGSPRSPRLQWMKQARNAILRVGRSYQEATLAQAFEEFVSLWIRDLQQGQLPAVQHVLCSLAAANRRVPAALRRQSAVPMWVSEVHRLCDLSDPNGPQGKAVLSLQQLTAALKRLSTLNKADAVMLVNEVSRVLAQCRGAGDVPLEHVEVLQAAAEKEEDPQEEPPPSIMANAESLTKDMQLQYLANEVRHWRRRATKLGRQRQRQPQGRNKEIMATAEPLAKEEQSQYLANEVRHWRRKAKKLGRQKQKLIQRRNKEVSELRTKVTKALTLMNAPETPQRTRGAVQASPPHFLCSSSVFGPKLAAARL